MRTRLVATLCNALGSLDKPGAFLSDIITRYVDGLTALQPFEQKRFEALLGSPLLVRNRNIR